MITDASRKSSTLAVGPASITAFVYSKLAGNAIVMYRGAWRLAAAGSVSFFVCSIPIAAGTQIETYSVTQKGQQFNPASLSIRHGERVEIVNDDGELIHHAYVDSQTFTFDSGDQEPGSKTYIDFSVPGKFVVLCGIHPKMRLDVVVK
jgi:plastocyanin